MKILSCLSLLFFAGVCSAQIKVGLTTGIHHSTISKADLREASGTINFHGGILVDIPISKTPVHFQPQLLYTTFGYEQSNIEAVDKSGFALGQIDNHRIIYIQIPAHFLYKIPSGKNSFKTGLGPWLAFKTGDRLTLEGGEKFGNETALPNSTMSINSILAGLSMHISAELSQVILGLTVQHSFNNMYENQNGTNYPKWKLTSAGISLGYYITPKRK